MKKNLKNVIINNSPDSHPIKNNQIIQTTIINSPKILSSENHVIIKQYINANDPDYEIKKNLNFKSGTKTENEYEDFNEKFFNNKEKLVYYRQGLNYNLNTLNKDYTYSTLNNSINTIFKRNYNNNIKYKNFYKNKNIKMSKKINNRNKTEKEDFLDKNINDKLIDRNIYIDSELNTISNDNTEIKNEFKIYKKIENIKTIFSKDNKLMNKTTYRNYNKLFEIENDKSNTIEKIMNKKIRKKVYSKDTNKIKNDKKDNDGKKGNISGLNLYIKKSPYQKQFVKSPDYTREDDTKKASYTKSTNSKKKINKENKDIIIENNLNIFKKNDLLDTIKVNTNKQICKKIILINKKKKDKKFLQKLKDNDDIEEDLSNIYSNKEISDNFMNNESYSITNVENMKKNNSLPKASFRFLLNKASQDKLFGESFHKAFLNNKDHSIGKSIDKIIKRYNNENNKSENKSKNDTLTYSNYSNENLTNDKNKNKNKKKILFNKIFKNKNSKENILKNNLNKLKHRINNDNNNYKRNNINNLDYKKFQTNEQLFEKVELNRTLNNFKPSYRNSKEKINLVVNKSNDNILRKSNIKSFHGFESVLLDEKNNDLIILSSIQPRKKLSYNSNNLIDIELLYNLENKILTLIYKIKKGLKFEEESFDLINYYFKNDISKYIIQLFNEVFNKNTIINYIKTELLSYFLCYDICFNINIEKVTLFLITIINIIYSNFLLLMSYIIKGYKNNSINFKTNQRNKLLLEYFGNIINQNINIEIKNDEITEENIIRIIIKGQKEINKYYKVVVENIYQKEYLNLSNKENNYKFPYCLKIINNINDNATIKQIKTKNSIIISSFFFESYQLSNNYSIIDLENFFYSFLYRTTKIKRNNQFILPKIDNSKYKYTLVLDLDETLVHCQKKVNNEFILLFRPGLYEFLLKMKNICELILFSYGTPNYVDSIIKIIEKNEKFFEYILDRNHVTYDNGNYVKDLNMLNRDLKNIIIIDDSSKFFKFHKENGICVKPFYGDIENDKNTLSILGNILEKIFYDVNITGDVRISLKKFRRLLNFSNIINYN